MSTRTETTIAAPIREVTLLEDRARVLRHARLTLAPGTHRLTIDAIAPVLVDRSLLAKITVGTATILDVRCRRRWVPAATPGAAADAAERRAALAELTARATTLARALADHADEVAASAADLNELCATRDLALAALARDAGRGEVPGDGATLAALDASIERCGRAHDEAILRRDADRTLAARLEQRRAEAQRDATELGAVVELDVHVADGAPAAIELTCEYQVPGACWRPQHRATLLGAQLRLETEACVWQRTGEDWRDVVLRFSTERPSLGAAPPTLRDDVLAMRRRADEVTVEAREQAITTAGLGVAAGAAATEVPGVDDGGEAQLRTALTPATVIADGRPWRIALGDHTSAVEVALVAIPERSRAAVVRCRASNGPQLLLAGPVDLVSGGGFAGRTRLLLVGPGERFELSAGVDPDVRVHREVAHRHDEAGLLGSWHSTRIRVAVRLSNLGDTTKTVLVTERVPVSELEKVEVVVAAEGAWRLETDDGTPLDPTPLATGRTIDRDGLTRWEVTLPPHGQRAIALEYTLRVHQSVVGFEPPT